MRKEIYTVRHCHPNPSHNTRETFSNRREAVAEMRLYTADNPGAGCSSLIREGKCIAFREWDRKRIQWI